MLPTVIGLFKEMSLKAVSKNRHENDAG